MTEAPPPPGGAAARDAQAIPAAAGAAPASQLSGHGPGGGDRALLFLASAGFGAAACAPVPQDAGHRAYTRLLGGPRPALLVDARAAARIGLDAAADLARFAALARHLSAHGVRAPAILAEAPGEGFLLVEDLGPRTMAEALDSGADPLPLYLAAAEALAALHRVPPPAGLPAWDAAAMAAAAAATFLDWWWPAALGAPPRPAQREGFHAAMRAMLAPFEGVQSLVHRDFFPANLIPRADGTLGVIDFQDAALGHPAYDLVSLVEDARRDVPPALREAVIARYAAAGGAVDRAAMAAMAAQRHLRVAALWVRLARRDGKPRYLAHGPRCWALFSRALAHPAALPLAAFLDAEVPPALRRNPEAG
ncbi:MAG: phosphotransferase [Acetobacteraceae bacterium]|nr:phosphotransferase [Acetobacteraceae bacterium]MDW8399679.1 phosphotransferase [Acetobacteraceae bacterium]